MVSMASELLPEPLGPQQTVNWSRGMSTSMPLRLCSPGAADLDGWPSAAGGCESPLPPGDGWGEGEAGIIASTRRPALTPGPSPEGRGEMVAQHAAGVGMRRSAASCSGVPAATMRPPAWPPSGPRSMIQSAVLIDLDVVLDHQHGIAGGHESVQHVEEQLDVGEVQAGGRLVQQVERPAGAFLDQLAGELDALGLAAGEGRRRLAELHVIQPHVVQRLQLLRRSSGMFSKCASASWMSISSTSAIDLPL